MPTTLMSIETALAPVFAATSADRAVEAVTRRIKAEYADMPGLSLTELQAARMCGVLPGSCRTALAMLVGQRFLRRTVAATYVRADLCR